MKTDWNVRMLVGNVKEVYFSRNYIVIVSTVFGAFKDPTELKTICFKNILG